MEYTVDQQLELIQSKFSISKSPIIGNSTLQSLDFIDCEVFSIVYDHLERGPRYARQLNAENSTRFPPWFRTEFLFKILFSVCCLRTPVWPVAPVPGDVPINGFPLLWQHGCEYQPCVRVALCLPYVKWLPPCSYMEYCYHGHIWVLFEATFIAESRFRAVTLFSICSIRKSQIGVVVTKVYSEQKEDRQGDWKQTFYPEGY